MASLNSAPILCQLFGKYSSNLVQLINQRIGSFENCRGMVGGRKFYLQLDVHEILDK
jgi:hypothetical protein